MKVIIAGSRDIEDINIVPKAMDRFYGVNITEVVSGKASGIDTLGEIWAEANDIPVKSFPANWKKYGKAAGPLRNKEMAEYADAAVVIHNGSKGSLNMISEMKKLGKPVYEVKYDSIQQDSL